MSLQRIVLVVGAVLAVSGGSACSSDSPSALVPPPEPPTAAQGRDASTAEKGLEAVKKRKCIDCHGENMAGATTPLKNFPPDRELYPPNLTPDIETGLGDANEPDRAKRGYTDELLARAIRQGYDKDDLVLCKEMKHDATMSDFEVYSIVKYLRSLPPVKQKILRSVCPPLKSKAEQAR